MEMLEKIDNKIIVSNTGGKASLLKTSMLGLGLFACTMLTAPAMAQDSDQLEALVARLEAALKEVKTLKDEVKALRDEKKADIAPVSVSTDALRDVQSIIEEQNERLEEIEDAVVDIEEQAGGRPLVRAFDAASLDVGGFLHSGLTHVNGENGSATSFNRLTFELLVKAKLSKKFSLFAAQAFIRESGINFNDPAGRLDPGFNIRNISPLVIATARYEASNEFALEAGRFITPHGIINIEHFPATLLDPEQPQFLRPFGGQTIFANFMNGFKAEGTFFTGSNGENKLTYSAYVGSFVNNGEQFNYGGRLGYSFGNSGLTLGANLGGGKRAPGDGADYQLVGADLLFDKGPILFKSEVFWTNEDLGEDRFAFYAQPAWRLNDQWTAFYRYDYLDNGLSLGDSQEHALGINYQPIPNIRLRGIVTRRDIDGTALLPDASLTSYQVSSTISF
jgi:hypothetical protein